MRMRWFIGLLLTVAIALTAVTMIRPGLVAPYIPAQVATVLGLSDDQGNTDDSARSRSRAVPVTVKTIRTATAKEVFSTSGEVIARDSVEVTAERPGRVDEVLVDDGQRVSRGDPIVRLDTGDAEAALSAAESAVREASNNLERQTKLASRDYAAEAEVEAARARLAAAEADVAAAQEQLADLTVRSPLDGAIGFIAVARGDYVQPGRRIVDVATVDNLRVRFDVPSQIATGLSEGDVVTVNGFAGGADQRSKIVEISPLASSAARSVAIESRLGATDTSLKPGMFLTVDVITKRREGALFISEAAVLRSGPASTIFVVASEAGEPIAKETSVTLGTRQDGLIEVRSDALTPSSRVVVEGLQKISDGQRISLQGAPDADTGTRNDQPGAPKDTAAAPGSRS
jgi:RND family efflux transporter MFP subunit